MRALPVPHGEAEEIVGVMVKDICESLTQEVKKRFETFYHTKRHVLNDFGNGLSEIRS